MSLLNLRNEVGDVFNLKFLKRSKSVDWTLTGALGGVAILAVAVGYEFSTIPLNGPEPANKHQAAPILIPARERAAVEASSRAPEVGYNLHSSSPTVGYAPAPQANTPRLSNATESPQISPPVEVSSRAKDHSAPPPVYSSSAHNEVKPSLEHAKPKISSDLWEVHTTAKASYFNLGGHVDKNGVVDSLASGYLRDALKKHQNYAKLPARIQAYINEPNINLAKIAEYRALLGIDDKEMEEKQGLQFIRIAASRGIEDTSASTIDFDASPIDLSSLDRMALDLRLGRTVP
jgi:hypothetical protein